MKIFLAITNMLVGFAKWSAITAAVIMTIMVFLQVIFRYVIGEALSFSEELEQDEAKLNRKGIPLGSEI